MTAATTQPIQPGHPGCHLEPVSQSCPSGRIGRDLERHTSRNWLAMAAVVRRVDPGHPAGQRVRLRGRRRRGTARVSRPLAATVQVLLHSAPSNTGLPSGLDLDNNGELVAARKTLLVSACFRANTACCCSANIRFERPQQNVSEIPVARHAGRGRPDAAGSGGSGSLVRDQEKAMFRLSSKSHWDVPLRCGQRAVHLLAIAPDAAVVRRAGGS